MDSLLCHDIISIDFEEIAQASSGTRRNYGKPKDKERLISKEDKKDSWITNKIYFSTNSCSFPKKEGYSKY